MECPQCKAPLIVSNSKYESEVGSTDVYSVLDLVCINPKCGLYSGTNLNNPLKVATAIKNKVN